MWPQVQGGPSPTFEFCGFELSKLEKAKLVARWAREYPELGEGKELGQDLGADAVCRRSDRTKEA